MTLKEKWESYESRIEGLDELRDKLYEQKRRCEITVDHSYANNKYVKAFLGENEIEPITSLEEFEQFMNEEANYITDCVTYKFFEINGYESNDEDKQEEQREWVFETLWYNVVQMYCATSWDAIDAEEMRNQQFRDCIYDEYGAEYENAKADLYYGYGYGTWYEGNGESFESEDDAKFVWHIAVERMANAD